MHRTETPTPAQDRALRILRAMGPLHPRAFAEQMWPDSPGWQRRSRRHDGKSGALGACMPMLAARFLWRLRKLGLAWQTNGAWYAE